MQAEVVQRNYVGHFGRFRRSEFEDRWTEIERIGSFDVSGGLRAGRALERDDRKVSPLRLETNRQTERDSRPTSDENLRRRAPRSSGPLGARFEPGRSTGVALT